MTDRRAGRLFLRAGSLLTAVGLLSGCVDNPATCILGLSHEDCAPPLTAKVEQFPADDVICRSYGLAPGTRSYAKCRYVKAAMRYETQHDLDAQSTRWPQ